MSDIGNEPDMKSIAGKGRVLPAQVDSAGRLRADAAAAWIGEAVQAWVAQRSTGDAAPSPRMLSWTLTESQATLGANQVAQVELRPATPESSFEARLVGPHADAWSAFIAFDRPVRFAALAGALPGQQALAEGLPPLRLLRPMRPRDCDQAGHVNVQVFMDLADEASRVLCIEHALAPGAVAIKQARIVFKRELFEGDLVAVHSGVRRQDADRLQVVHGIVHRASGEVACVVETWLSLDSAPPALAKVRFEPQEWPSLPAAREGAMPRAGELAPAAAVTTSLCVVDAWDADDSGHLGARALVNLCSSGARQYLASIGLDSARMQAESITVAAVDYSLTVLRQAPLGAHLLMRSAFLSGSAKSIRFSHHLVDAQAPDSAEAVYAVIEIVGVMLDLKTHRSTLVPPDVQQRLGLAAPHSTKTAETAETAETAKTAETAARPAA